MTKKLDSESYEELNALSIQKLSKKRKPLLKSIYTTISSFLESTEVDVVKALLIDLLQQMAKNAGIEMNYPRKRFIEHCISSKELTPQMIDSIMLQRQYIDSFTDISPGLYITTIHQSKGKEFDCVYVVDVSSLSGDRNLLYVSHSRMREKLFPIAVNYTGTRYA